MEICYVVVVVSEGINWSFDRVNWFQLIMIPYYSYLCRVLVSVAVGTSNSRTFACDR